MAQINRLKEVEMLLDAYEATDMAPEEFSKEFFHSVQMIIRRGIPCREQRLSIKVPFKKPDLASQA